MLYGDWKEILNTAQLKAAQSYVDQLSIDQLNIAQLRAARLSAVLEDNVISQIEEQLALKSQDAYREWEAQDFNINSLFLLNVGHECTLLHISACYGLEDIVSVLLRKGADVDSLDQYGQTPLHIAVDNSYIDIVNALLKSGANVNAIGQDRTTPLHIAAENDDLDIVNALLKSGARVNVTDRNKETPLHVAARNGHIEVVNALLKKGANPFLKDKNDQTPRDLTSNDDIKQLFEMVERRQHLNSITEGVTFGVFIIALQVLVVSIIMLQNIVVSMPIKLIASIIAVIVLMVVFMANATSKPSTQVNEMQVVEVHDNQHNSEILI